MRRVSFNILLITVLVLVAAAGVYAVTQINTSPSAQTENYLLTISEISSQQELSAPEGSGADSVMLYELPVGSVISLTARTDGISHEIACYNERNRKIESFAMTSDGYGRGEEKKLAIDQAVSYAVTYSDMDYAFMSINITEEDETTSFYFRVIKASEPEVAEESQVQLIVTAVPTASQVLVNGEVRDFLAYNINDYNYFKLRDIAAVLNGTEKQFEVVWDAESNSISLRTGKPYEVQSGDLATDSTGESMTGLATQSKIVLDGDEVSFVAYNIGGNNYFKLRDLGEALDFNVDWDPITKNILIDSSQGYTE